MGSGLHGGMHNAQMHGDTNASSMCVRHKRVELVVGSACVATSMPCECATAAGTAVVHSILDTVGYAKTCKTACQLGLEGAITASRTPSARY